MARKAKPRLPSAGEVVSWFEDMPVELAATVLDIVTVRVAIRREVRDRPYLTKEPKAKRKSVPADPDTSGNT